MRPYVVTSPEGNVVARADSQESAHRASRRVGAAGDVSRNRAGRPEVEAMTPVEIDTILSKLWQKTWDQRNGLANASQRLERIKNPARRYPAYESAADVEKEIEKYRAEIAVLRAEAAPYEAEHERRRWNRYFLVQNVGGHVHRGTSCSTCFPTTRYHWIVDLADVDEGKMVEEYGEKACTVCFPNAPTHPSFAGPGLRGSAAVDARAARTAAAAERRAAREAKVAATKARAADLKARREAIRVDLAEQLRALAAVGDVRGAEVLAKKQKKHMSWLFLRDLDVDDALLALGLADPIPEAAPGDRHRVRYRYWMWQ